jgi:hypothetical protein
MGVTSDPQDEIQWGDIHNARNPHRSHASAPRTAMTMRSCSEASR